MKRLTMIWLTVLALLAQGWTSAAMASAVKLPAKVETVAMAGMEHCAMHDRAPASDSKSGDCCSAMLNCHCVSACGNAALLPALVAFPQVQIASPIAASASTPFSAAPAAHPFRPPIL